MSAATAQLGLGRVWHARSRPSQHAFTYPTYYLMLPMRSLRADPSCSAGLSLNRPGLISFYDRDHGDGRGPQQGGALAWLEGLLHQAGITDATGEVWLQSYPRVLGYTFKPVSFWYCHRAAHDQGGALRAIVVEVNNTFGERHCYLLDQPQWGVEQRCTKVFHVSPFNTVQGHYRFQFVLSEQAGQRHQIARVDYYDGAPAGADHPGADSAAVLQTSISGSLQPVNRASLRQAFWRYPAMTLGVVLHIHTQALRLWLKRVPFFRKPVPPAQFVSR